MTDNNLTIDGSKSSPTIYFNASSGVLEISGESYPENSYEFYRPVLLWLSRFCGSYSGDLVLNCRVSYLNTGSTKSMMDIFDLLEDRHRRGLAVQVNWYCDRGNDRAVETAEEFSEDVSFPFTIKTGGLHDEQ